MKIQKSSKVGRYHAWLCGYFNSEPWRNLTLCSLVQGIFWRTLFLLGLGIGVFIMCITILIILFYPILVLLNLMEVDNFILFWDFIFYSLIIFVFVKHLIQKYGKEEKEPSLVIEWVKAKKKKICPFIEVVE